jgi:3-methyladenine DNA glycosylase AlkD
LNEVENILSDIGILLEKYTPNLSADKRNRMYKIINPDIEDYIILGVRTSELEKITKEIQEKYNPSFNMILEIFKKLAKTNVEENKFVAFFLLNRYKKHFLDTISDFFKSEYFPYCHTWSTCDSCCIRVLGPFLAKKNNSTLARNTIDDWNHNPSIWIKRASIVLLLKIIMVQRDFDEQYIFEKVEELLVNSNVNYIAKAIGWLLKTCSKFKPEIITQFLIENQDRFSRVILRYASEKLPKEKRDIILKK